MELWQRLGLDINNPVTNKTDGGYMVDNIQVDALEDVDGNLTHSRQT